MTEPSKTSLQAVILRLHQFWADQGCVIWQPYHTEVGAGTMNPGTFLRVLGPEDWRVAYVEPSIRPTDSRYGENPNRWGHYYQYQVILKPDPGDPQERYLDSLLALGIDPAQHDIRFVEDNWEQPALGAWGLGWEVWLDGQEITQFTYFQQAGGLTLDPVAVEITYGLERILLALQGVDTFLDIQWNDAITYGEISLEPERENSRYTFELADVERLRTLYAEYEAEAESCLRAGLVFPAHDYILKCSHTFNLLDGRGAVGVTERMSLFGRMRELARGVAEAYVAEREAAGFPWRGRWPAFTLPKSEADEGPAPKEAAPFLLEIGTEELPHRDLTSALEQLQKRMAKLLAESNLEHGALKVFGTPRRLVAFVEDLAPMQAESVALEKGPPAERAFDKEGQPTKAAQGFARSRGVGVEALEVREIDGGRYVVAEVRRPGQAADAVLAPALEKMIAALRFDKTMRWNDTQVAFSRPIRWLLALHGGHVMPLGYAGLHSGRSTRLMRFDDQAVQAVPRAEAYFEVIRAAGIEIDPFSRRRLIEEQIRRLAAEVDGSILEDEELLDEVTNLVERPTALRGEFDSVFLELPRAVLITVMRKHQRYFPVVKGDKLLPYFITVRNGGGEFLDVVQHGNEQVLRARFADADYFYRKDLRQPLEAFLPRLETLTFQSKLGSMRDKVARIERLTGWLAKRLALTSKERKLALRAAHLCKADLATQMVIELTSLQGEMGREYALAAGEPVEVAEAILEHYLPRSASDRLPESRPGIAVGLADRLDTLIGLFAAGMQPTGTRDPFALRRAAIGLVQILAGLDLDLDLKAALRAAAEEQPIKVSRDAEQDCLAFIVGRQQALLLAEGQPHDAVEAVLEAQGANPARAARAVAALDEWRKREDWPQILQAYARCVRITRSIETRYEVTPQRFELDAERELYAALQSAQSVDRQPGSVDDFFAAFLPMMPQIERFFEDVLVMAEDEAIQHNRLAVLQQISALADGVADFSKLEGF